MHLRNFLSRLACMLSMAYVLPQHQLCVALASMQCQRSVVHPVHWKNSHFTLVNLSSVCCVSGSVGRALYC